jgi:hypothetical protein
LMSGLTFLFAGRYRLGIRIPLRAQPTQASAVGLQVLLGAARSVLGALLSAAFDAG